MHGSRVFIQPFCTLSGTARGERRLPRSSLALSHKPDPALLWDSFFFAIVLSQRIITVPIVPDTVSDFGSFALTNPSKAPIYGSSRRLYLSGRVHNGGPRREERRHRELCSQAGQDRLRPLKRSGICAWNPRRHCCRHDGRRVTSDQEGLVCLLQD